MPDIDHVRPGPGNSDFQGWASKNNLLCTDGRVIRENAFARCCCSARLEPSS